MTTFGSLNPIHKRVQLGPSPAETLGAQQASWRGDLVVGPREDPVARTLRLAPPRRTYAPTASHAPLRHRIAPLRPLATLPVPPYIRRPRRLLHRHIFGRTGRGLGRPMFLKHGECRADECIPIFKGVEQTA